jgi:UrcA family protein
MAGAAFEQEPTMRHIQLLAVIAASLAAPSSAFARAEITSVRVAYGDLNLSTQAGRSRFESRLAAAVKRVCPAADFRDLRGTQANRRCVAETHARMKPAVASAMQTRAVAAASMPKVALARP